MASKRKAHSPQGQKTEGANARTRGRGLSSFLSRHRVAKVKGSQGNSKPPPPMLRAQDRFSSTHGTLAAPAPGTELILYTSKAVPQEKDPVAEQNQYILRISFNKCSGISGGRTS